MGRGTRSPRARAGRVNRRVTELSWAERPCLLAPPPERFARTRSSLPPPPSFSVSCPLWASGNSPRAPALPSGSPGAHPASQPASLGHRGAAQPPSPFLWVTGKSPSRPARSVPPLRSGIVQPTAPGPDCGCWGGLPRGPWQRGEAWGSLPRRPRRGPELCIGAQARPVGAAAAPRRHGGGTAAAQRRHSGGTAAAWRRHSGGTAAAQRRAWRAWRKARKWRNASLASLASVARRA
jgi:hypothetical protein